ncbi:MAG: hypothetical protein JNL83_11700 [Myxococcales bacterium]|nr:hypothetical protein [Myxococcales bacterium]
MGPAIGVFVLVLFLIAIAAVAMRGSYEGTLKALGQPYGLAYDRHRDGFGVGVGHSLRGYLDGRPFLLIVAPGEGGGVLEEAWTISLAGQLPYGFAAGKNGWLRSADQGTARVQSGDPELDKLVFVQAIDAAGAWHVFGDARRRTALVALANLNGVIYGNQVTFHKSGFDNNVTKLRARLEALRAIAQAIDPVQPQPSPPQPYPPQPYPPQPYPPPA